MDAGIAGGVAAGMLMSNNCGTVNVDPLFALILFGVTFVLMMLIAPKPEKKD